MERTNYNLEINHKINMAKISNKQFAESLYEITIDLDGKDLELVLQKFVELLFRHHKLTQATRIIIEFESIVKKKEGVVELEITSARELDSETIAQIKKVFGKKVEALQRVDNGLIGGIKIKMEDKILDGSVRTQINSLKKCLVNN
ncbi:MAG: ATP synthase F1 subunit delta [Candidatus Magasanikbacteria bacterium CG_4_10_14_0_2_um_filter_37_12]|uniref:ATP synthase subunit delta n=1 Tax=Candidatus Magasanikbacteria bacterium CG_4_10_14_0_2_um_filter_37_12 TaxID=1974637 RepID=A0A2M7V880_9BACT|nr:MAG: ATP synthase F1 subunit delta [Candidatus Magasanikbacteria bacterium CG_4_10_14_0_2_um_filter_37_12]